MAADLGYRNLFVYHAGEPAWKEAGLPLWGNEPSGVVAMEPKDLPKVAPGELPRVIGSDEFKELVAAGDVVVLDVRSADEYNAGHIPGAINLPDDQFHANFDEMVKQVPTDQRVVIHCLTNIRAEGVYHALATRGNYENPEGVQYLDSNISISEDGSFTLH